MFLLAVKFVKNCHILVTIFSIFLKNVLKQTRSSFNIKFQPQWKDRKSSHQVRQGLGLSGHLIALTLDENHVKGRRVTKNVTEIKFEGVWGELELKKSFQRQ